ncbi:MAG: NlpC/P60 family protein, partial [Candidatus Kapaibacterium sp.]
MRKWPLLLVLGVVIAVLSGCSSTSRVRVSAPPALQPVVDKAMDLLGTSYCNAGTTPDCFDCSGFVSYCFVSNGFALPRVSADMFRIGSTVEKNDLQGGDLVFFSLSGGRINHVGIALNDKQFIHSSSSKGVSIAPFTDT